MAAETPTKPWGAGEQNLQQCLLTSEELQIPQTPEKQSLSSLYVYPHKNVVNFRVLTDPRLTDLD